LAQRGKDELTVPSFVKELDMSFSGAETFIVKKINEYAKEDIAYAVQKNIAKTLAKAIFNASQKYKLNDILLVGGVSSNNYIKEYLTNNLKKCNLYFGDKHYCVDNSVGIALLGVDYAKTNINCK
jgi:N6-L-threonylcarbamoyladenine synthase